MDEYWVVDDSLEGYQNGLPSSTNREIFERWFRGYLNPWDQLNIIFSKYDETGFGEMTMDQFRAMLSDEDIQHTIINLCGEDSWQRIRKCTIQPRSTEITYQEFVDVLSNKRRRSFKMAVHQRDAEMQLFNDDFNAAERGERQSMPLKTRVAYTIADEFLPDPRERKYYAEQYNCWPPPFFILFVTMLELAVYIYYTVRDDGHVWIGPVPIDSVFIYGPDTRLQLWRILSYVLVHAGWYHLGSNLIVQVFVGLPLEMVHGSCRIAIIYLAGVLTGPVVNSVIEPYSYLCGASGGVYALIAAHAANMLLNYSQMEFCGLLIRISGIIIIASMNVGHAVWYRYDSLLRYMYPISYLGHLAGALAGLTVGLAALKNFDHRFNEKLVWWVALSLYGAFLLFGIIWNVFFTRQWTSQV